MRLVLGTSDYDLDEDRARAFRLLEAGTDGLLLTPSFPFARGCRARIGGLPVPVVVVERRPHHALDLGHLDFVATGHTRGTVQALRQLGRTGPPAHRAPTTPSATSDGIREGFDAVTELFGLAANTPRVTDHQPGSVDGVVAFLDADETALVVDAARRRGLIVPDDLREPTHLVPEEVLPTPRLHIRASTTGAAGTRGISRQIVICANA
ncbi:hypothetical protein [Streptomyces formicae]|uniref:Uncharacterized protein n=1 Tax=Streptomyces formicae TaxID=1616117 RepID=A0ABY3WJW5_9ACTN|nr:hypothetical protein [Streptomyces formicae]UNM11769.1 hypothetical protein J4032_09625 [Streptomyces formicae]